jgi:hypothetical protein
MFIKKIDKTSSKTGKTYFTYRLCESYRIDDKVRHRSILNVGKLENIRREDFKLLCDRIEQKIRGINMLFNDCPEHIENEADRIYRRILSEKLLDCSTQSVPVMNGKMSESTDIQKVDVNSISNDDSRSFGGEWLCKQIFDDCGLPNLLSQEINNEVVEKHMAIEVISRMVHPSLELETSRRLAGESSLCEIYSLQKTPDHRKLYKAASTLYRHKDKIEDFLYQHFASKYPDRMRLCLYDLTNFYFEGRKQSSALAQFGRSKEKRKDTKLVSLALLTNGQGFIRRSNIYAGNISEPATLQTVISELESAIKKEATLFNSKPVAVMDAGTTTEENLQFLRQKGFDYICVSRSNLQDYNVLSKKSQLVYDNRNNPIELSIVEPVGKDTCTLLALCAAHVYEVRSTDDLYLYVKSHQKQQKEMSIKNKLTALLIKYIFISLSQKNDYELS